MTGAVPSLKGPWDTDGGLSPGALGRLALQHFSRTSLARGLARLAGQDRLTVLCYHHVADDEGPLFRGLDITVTPAQFGAQLRFVRDHYDVAALPEILAGRRRGDGRRRTVVVTFDDGYRSVLTHALPRLQESGIRAALFVCPAYIGNQRLPLQFLVRHASGTHGLDRVAQIASECWGRTVRGSALEAEITGTLTRTDHEQLKAHMLSTLSLDERALAEELRLFLTWDEVRTLREAGVTIGNHSLTHQVLSGLPAVEQRDEIETARRAIVAQVGEGALPFAFPYGRRRHYQAATTALVEATGHSCALALGGDNPWGTSPFALERTLVTPELPFETNVEVLPVLERARTVIRIAAHRLLHGAP